MEQEGGALRGRAQLYRKSGAEKQKSGEAEKQEKKRSKKAGTSKEACLSGEAETQKCTRKI